jgi:hypothetical protein
MCRDARERRSIYVEALCHSSYGAATALSSLAPLKNSGSSSANAGMQTDRDTDSESTSAKVPPVLVSIRLIFSSLSAAITCLPQHTLELTGRINIKLYRESIDWQQANGTQGVRILYTGREKFTSRTIPPMKHETETSRGCTRKLRSANSHTRRPLTTRTKEPIRPPEEPDVPNHFQCTLFVCTAGHPCQPSVSDLTAQVGALLRLADAKGVCATNTLLCIFADRDSK